MKGVKTLKIIILYNDLPTGCSFDYCHAVCFGQGRVEENMTLVYYMFHLGVF